MGDKFTMTTGQAHELAMAFGRNGWTNADVKKMSEGDLLAKILPVVRGGAEVKTSSLPTEITVGGRTYEILSFLREGEDCVPGCAMVARAEKVGANLRKEDCEFLLAHQDEIPPVLRSKIVFVFPGWRHPDAPGKVACLTWGGGSWYQFWHWLVYVWHGHGRVLRRK